MTTDPTERRQRCLDMAAAHADDFRTRVAEHDQDSTFPHENVEAMKASGYTALIVPEEAGGIGATPMDVAVAQERLAYGDLPMAIAVNMHHIVVGIVADLWRLNRRGEGPRVDAAESLLKATLADKVVFAGPVSDPKMNSSVGFAGINDTTRRLTKADGGYRLNGRSGFGTMSACADYILTTAHYDAADGDPQCMLCFFPTNSEGVEIQDNWDTLSIRSSLSNDVVWNDVFVPDDNAVPRRALDWDEIANITSSWWVAGGPACYIGLAQAARDYAVDWVAGRTQQPFDQPMTRYPGNQLLAGEMEIGLRSARAMLHQAVASHDDVAVRSGEDLVNLVSCFQFVMETCFQIVDKAMRMVGGAALFKKNPMEQMYRDARAAVIHQPFAGMEGKALLGRRIFGLPVYTSPRSV